MKENIFAGILFLISLFALIFHIDVDREMYDAIDIGMRGLLRLVDGHLNSFEPDNI